MRIHRLLLAMAVTAAVAAGCGSVRAPEVELNAIRVAGIGLRGASLVAELDINNVNDFDIETDSIAYQLFGNTGSSGAWEPVLQRTVSQRIVLPEDRMTRVEIPIEFDYSDLGGAARAILDRGTFNYRIQGQVFVREPLRRTMPFTKTGRLSLTGAR
jgi:LEA14-like dessication related protein